MHAFKDTLLWYISNLVNCSNIFLICESYNGTYPNNSLFFDRLVVKEVWNFCADTLGLSSNSCFESIARFWISRKKDAVLNLCTSAIM